MIPDLAINRLAGALILCLIAAPALADVSGPARVIDGGAGYIGQGRGGEQAKGDGESAHGV